MKPNDKETRQVMNRYMAVWDDQADACLLLDATLEIIWRNRTAMKRFPKLVPGVNILDYGDDVLSCMVKMNLYAEGGITARCTISGTGCFLCLCGMPGKDRQFLCRLRKRFPDILLPEAALKDLMVYEQTTAGVFGGLYDRLTTLQDENQYAPAAEDYFIDCIVYATSLFRFTEISSAYAMLKKGTLPHLIRKVNLTEYLSTIFQSSVNLLQGVNLDLAYHYDRPLKICTEPLYLLRILGELFSNAFNFQSSVHSMVTVWYELHDDTADIYVENIGSVPEIALGKMYKPLFSIYSTNDNIFHGHGLGLSAAEKYADFIGGKLTLTEWSNKTVFKLSFPFLNEAEYESECSICETHIRAQLRILLSDVIAMRAYMIENAFHYHRKG